MDDLMSKLQSVLNDEESMNQIKELANMLGSEQGESAEVPVNASAQPPMPAQKQAPDFSQLLASLGGLSGDGGGVQQQPSVPASPTGGLDIAKLMQLGTVISTANKSDKNVELLLALKPLLKEESQVKIDRLIKIFKLFAIYPVLKESGLLGGDLFGLL